MCVLSVETTSRIRMVTLNFRQAIKSKGKYLQAFVEMYNLREMFILPPRHWVF